MIKIIVTWLLFNILFVVVMYRKRKKKQKYGYVDIMKIMHEKGEEIGEK
ncbi:hypothetical protein [Orenia marismortui]|nr:hypothetical protein [Orenia marismortui]